MDAVRALDDDALQLVESSIIPNLKAWGCACAFVAPKNPRLIRCFSCQADFRRMIDVTAATSDWHPPHVHMSRCLATKYTKFSILCRLTAPPVLLLCM